MEGSFGTPLIYAYGYGDLFHDPDAYDHEAHDPRNVHGRDLPFALHGRVNDCAHVRVHGNVRARVDGCAFYLHAHEYAHAHACVHVCDHVCACDRLP